MRTSVTINAGGGTDTINGSFLGDSITPGAGTDTINEEAAANGTDTINGDAGTDTVNYSGRGNAVTVTVGTGATDGEAGDGTLLAADGQRDIVNCGAGRNDKATVDRFDVVSGCENITRR